MDAIRVGIIGTGVHGSRYAHHILNGDVEGLDLRAICRRSYEGQVQSAKWKVKWFQDYGDLIRADNVDAIISATPPVFNLDIARLCVEVKKPLLLEKPLAVDSETASEIVDIFMTSDPGLTVGQTLRYNSIVSSLKDNFSSIGRFCGFHANQRLEPSTLEWHEQPELAGAGVSFHTAVHVFDALRFITNLEVRRVISVQANYHNSRLEDMLTVLLEMDDTVFGTVDCSKVGKARSGRFEFIGFDGQLYGDQIHDILDFVRGTTITPIKHKPPVSTIPLLLADWRDYLLGRRNNPVAGEEGLMAVKICEACLLSSRTGNWVQVLR